MNCPWCNVELAYVQKLTGRHFCSPGHHKLYLTEQDRLFLNRLKLHQRKLRRSFAVPANSCGFVFDGAVAEMAPDPIQMVLSPPESASFPLQVNVRSFAPPPDLCQIRVTDRMFPVEPVGQGLPVLISRVLLVWADFPFCL